MILLSGIATDAKRKIFLIIQNKIGLGPSLELLGTALNLFENMYKEHVLLANGQETLVTKINVKTAIYWLQIMV